MSKKTIIGVLIAGILILAIPLTVKLVQTQLQLKSRASGNEISFPDTDTHSQKCQGNVCTTTKADIQIQLDSPYGPQAP